MPYSWEELVQLARLAEKAMRYDDMTEAMKKVVELDGKLNEEERNLFSAAYRKCIGEYRSSCRAIISFEQKTKKDFTAKQQQMVKDLLKKLECKMNEKGHEVLGLLDKLLIPRAGDNHVLVFYLKMKADFYRYLAEMTTDPDVVEKSHTAYREAFDIAKSKIRPFHPLRLAIALNFAVFVHDVLHLPEEACRMAKQAYDDAHADLMADATGDFYLRSVSIMVKLQDNQTLWTHRDD